MIAPKSAAEPTGRPSRGWRVRWAALGKTVMSVKVTSFLTDWLRSHVVGRVAGIEDIPMLAFKCLIDASREGISQRDIERVVGPVEDCIRLSLRQVTK